MRKIAIPKKVGAHKPTKIPNLSAWAFCSEPSPFLMFQIATEPIMERRLKTKQIQDAVIIFNHYYGLLIFQLNLPVTFHSNRCLGDHASFVIIAIQAYPPPTSSSRFSASLSEFNDLFQRKSRLIDKRFSLSFFKIHGSWIRARFCLYPEPLFRLQDASPSEHTLSLGLTWTIIQMPPAWEAKWSNAPPVAGLGEDWIRRHHGRNQRISEHSPLRSDPKPA